MDLFDLREPASAWSHLVGLLLVPPGTWLLWRRAEGAPAKRLTLLVFGLSLAFCYASSTLYHGLRLGADRLDRYDRLDRIGIFVLIAGTYTPMAWNLMRGRWRWGTLATVWLVTAGAAAWTIRFGSIPLLASTGLYLGMGWGSLLCYREVARIVSHRALLPLVAGGVAYSVGAVINLLEWPNLWPVVFGAHELFHLFVIAGSLAHFRLMLTTVIPVAARPRPAER